MDTKTQETQPPVQKKDQEQEQGVRYFQSPRDFYEEMNQRSDIKKILAKLAKK